MTNLGPLTTTFTPSSACASYTGLSQVYYSGSYSFLVEGPRDTYSECFPHNYAPNTEDYYSPGLCPSGYTAACTSQNSLGSLTETVHTCCPAGSDYDFACNGNVHWPWESTQGCTSEFTEEVTLTDLTGVSGRVTSSAKPTAVGGDGGRIGAAAIVVRFQEADFATTTSKPPNSSTTPSDPIDDSGAAPGLTGQV